MDRAPKPGETPLVSTRKSVEGWLQFVPALAYFNGFLDFPQDLPECAIVRTVEDRSQSHGPFTAVRVIETVPLHAFRDRFRAKMCRDLGLLSEAGGPFTDVRAGRFTYVDFDAQGDFGAWAVTEQVEASTHVLLYGEWSVGGYEEVFAGNGLMTERLLAAMDTKSKPAQI